MPSAHLMPRGTPHLMPSAHLMPSVQHPMASRECERRGAVSGRRAGSAPARLASARLVAAPRLGSPRRRAARWAARCQSRNRRRPTLPGPCGPSTIGAERLNCSVRNGKRCFPLAVATGKRRESPRALQNCTVATVSVRRVSKSHPSSPRPISTGLLNTLLYLQIRPINLVVYQGSYSLMGMGEFISRLASRLDAFSGYPIRT